MAYHNIRLISEASPEFLGTRTNEGDSRFSGRWFKTLMKEQSIRPSDYLFFFGHRLLGLSENIELGFSRARCGPGHAFFVGGQDGW